MISHINNNPSLALPKTSKSTCISKNQISSKQAVQGKTDKLTKDSPAIPKWLSSLEKGQKNLDALINKAMKGQTFTAGQLLVLQAHVYTFNQQMEVVSRVVDRTISAVKTTLNTQI